MGERRTVAVLGASGLVGRACVGELAEEYDLRLFDRRPVRGSEVRRLDACRLGALTRALRGCDAVVDLAADARWDAPWESVYRTNIRLARTVLEAARVAGVHRVVQASSNQVTAGYEHDEPWRSVLAGRRDELDPSRLPRIRTSDPTRPISPYGAAKAFAEAACSWYAQAHGLSTISLRIGTVLEPDQPRNERHFSTWLSHRDLQGLLRSSIDASPDLTHTVVWGASANTWGIWDLAEGAARINYTPMDDAESHRTT